ncbi:TIGR02300 family protein [Sphingobium sp. AN641]|uniref:TIGR02300 family protein n=1 Tax=Sphingobium sp. AN641 TaxID=3133443 RepID=UPI0030C64292
MVKAEWGTKRTCPKCATRFYDLGKDSPVVCINCGNPWDPEPVLKSKQPLPYEEAAPKKVVETADGELETADDDLDIDIDVDDDDVSPDNDVDLGGDDDLGVDAAGDDSDDDN